MIPDLTIGGQSLEDSIRETLAGDAQKNALDFAAWLRATGMSFERGKGYWEDKFYWMVKYKGEYVCFILVNGSEDKMKDKTELEGWTVWSDDSDSTCFEDFPLDEPMKEIAWQHVDICAKCGGCVSPGGTRKTVFGKEFDGVCITTMKFVNPDAETLACVKKLAEIRKNDIGKHI